MSKKIILAIALISISFSAMSQRPVDRSSFKAGVHAGVLFGDASDYSNIELGLDLGYHWAVSEFVDVGIVSGFMNAFGNTDTDDLGPIVVEAGFKDIQYIPAAAAFRFYPTYDFKLGADVGYAVGINEGNEGGFYLRPMIGGNISGNTELNISYVKISDDYDFSMVALGLLFLF